MGTRFKKYPSIINHYSSKDIHYWLSINPGLLEADYIIQEKIDGANVSFYIPPDGDIISCSRNRVLPPEENFFGLPAVLKTYEEQFAILQSFAKKIKKVVRPYGELFGNKVINRVNYGDKTRIKLFDIKIDEKWQTPEDFVKILVDLKLDTMLVPIYKIVKGVREVLEYNVEVNSALWIGDEGTNLIEGIVGKPLNLVQESPDGSVFRIKNKNEKFLEKMHKKKKAVQIDGTLLELQKEFESYLSESRLIGIFSKYGEIWKPSQIGEYIKYMMDDANEEFCKDNPSVNNLDKKSRKAIYKTAGSKISSMLKDFMGKGSI